MPEWIQVWAQAIAQFEGFNTAGSRPARNNNPGDLKYAGQPGATGQDSAGFAIFPDPATGWQALYNQLNAYVNEFPNFSILQMMAHYLGQPTPTSDSQGNAFTYASFVASQLGVDPSTTLASLAAGAAAAVASAASTPSDGTDQDSGGSGDGSSTPGAGTLVGLAVAGGLVIWALFRMFGSS